MKTNFVFLVLVFLLCSCHTYKSSLSTVFEVMGKTESNRVERLYRSRLSNEVINAPVWGNQKAVDSIYVINRPVYTEYKRALRTYALAVSDYSRLVKFHKIFNSLKLDHSDTLFVVEKMKEYRPEVIETAFFKKTDNVFYVPASRYGSFKSYCSNFIFEHPITGYTTQASSFNSWISEMGKNPFNPLKSNEDLYLVSLFGRDGKTIKLLDSIMFLN